MSSFTKLHVIQADIIFKALYYVANNEGIELPEELNETFKVLAERNPQDTDAVHTVEVMEYLNEFIKNSDEYSNYYLKEEDKTTMQ